MDRKMVTLILSLALVGCFFLPYIDLGYFGKVNGFNIVFPKDGGGEGWERYIWLLIPVAGILLVFGALSNENYFLGRGFLSWLPLLALIFCLIVSPMIHGAAIGDVFKTLGKGYGVGLWITIVASLILAFYNPRARA
jgi:hypothetical protein